MVGLDVDDGVGDGVGGSICVMVLVVLMVGGGSCGTCCGVGCGVVRRDVVPVALFMVAVVVLYVMVGMSL